MVALGRPRKERVAALRVNADPAGSMLFSVVGLEEVEVAGAAFPLAKAPKSVMTDPPVSSVAPE